MNQNHIAFHKELATTIAYQIEPATANVLYQQMKNNRIMGISLDDIEATLAPDATQVLYRRAKGSTADYEALIVGDAEEEDRWGEIRPEDEVVNVLYVTSAIMRNSGACSIGSMQHKQKLEYASRMPQTIAHIIVMNSPGGSVDAIYDYQMGIDACHSAGQPVLGWIKGYCASLCCRLSACCDEVYYEFPKNKIGSIGTMSEFDIMKHGDKNPSTGETHVELYADASTEKNGLFRAAADGNFDPLREHLNLLNDEFINEMRCKRPGVKDEHLNGSLFDCSEVEGILVTGCKSFDDTVARAIELAGGAAPVAWAGSESSEPQAPAPCPEEPDSKCNPKKKCSTDSCEQSHDSNPHDKMIETNLQSALVEAQSALAEAQATLAEREQALQEAQAALDAANAQQEQQQSEEVEALNSKLSTLNSEVESLNSQLSTLNAQLAERDETIASHVATIAERDTTIASLEATIAERDNTIASHVATIAERDTQVESLNSQLSTLNAQLVEAENTISELAHQPSATATPSPATAGEGEGDEGKKAPESACASQPGMTIAERRAAQKARDKQLGI